MTPTLTFSCSICGEASTQICVYCTKDACRNHRCERCKRCSDCCECEVPLGANEPEPVPAQFDAAAMNGAGAPDSTETAPEPPGGFHDEPPAPIIAPWVDVVAQEPNEPPFPEPPIEPDPSPAPDPFPQPEPMPRPEPPVPTPQFGLPPEPVPRPEPPIPDPEPRPEPGTPASDPRPE